LNICLISAEYPSETTGWGGIGTYVHALAHGLARYGHDVHVITAGQQERVCVADGVSVHYVPTRPWPLPVALRRRGTGIWALLERSFSVLLYLRRLQRTTRFDIVEAANWGAEALFFSLRPTAPLIVRVSTPFVTVGTIQGRVEYRRLGPRLHRWLEALPVRRASRVIANSRFTQGMTQREYGVPLERIRVVWHGLDLDRQSPSSEPAVDARPLVLYVGRLERRKGTQYLLQAIPAVVEAVPEARFHLVGKDTGDAPGGTDYRQYFAGIATPEAQAATTFRGFVDADALEEEYRSCDVFVAPSLFESFGLIHLEAMARGKPVDAFRAAATPEIVADGETGILVEPEDSAGLAEALIRLLQAPETARMMGQHGRERAEREFSLDQMVKGSLAVYSEVAGSC
jgi:glycosyltransferase involved in cell wall biosynthesis